FRHFGVQDGFRSEVIQSITEDKNGNLWVGTNDGLVYFDPKAAVENKGGVRAVYDEHDGLLSSSLVRRATTADSTGRLYVGTAGGAVTFLPGRLPANTHLPPVVLTDLRVHNQSLLPREEAGAPLSKSITLSETITLRYHQDMVEFRFAALDYHRPVKNQYAYRLRGFDDRWLEVGNRNSATFTNLAPGEYTFEVKASNSDGKWNPKPTTLRLRVLPPPWQTWWAWIAYVGLGLGLLYVLFRWRLRSRTQKIKRLALLEATRMEERERLRRKNAADFHDELGHRLTKISLLLELADRQTGSPDQRVRQYLGKIREHASSLSESVRDLIWGLDPEKDNLYQTLLRLQEFGDRLFEYSAVRFRAEGLDPALRRIELPLETKKQLLFLFKEAMNNTLRHAQAGLATLAFHRTEDKLFFTFWDDGIGLSGAESKGYGLQNMRMRAAKLGGELTIASERGEGTSVRFALEIPRMEDTPLRE
ncbi:MAG: triple tyrosine motif-containing protein, partial [Bacteroidota bacterium]